jgi:rRNA maturation RNase YbeY
LTQYQQRVEQILRGLGCAEDSVLSITIVDSSIMSEINYQYRGKEGPTNVLSFSQKESGDSFSDPNLLGDVVICWDRVVSDAESLGYTTDEMLTYVLIHGILHIVGFDHDSNDNAQAMETMVSDIFQRFFPDNSETVN